MKKIQKNSILVRVTARFEFIGSQLRNYQSGNTFSLNENLNYSEATSKIGKVSRDKLSVEKGIYSDAFSFTPFLSLC